MPGRLIFRSREAAPCPGTLGSCQRQRSGGLGGSSLREMGAQQSVRSQGWRMSPRGDRGTKEEPEQKGDQRQHHRRAGEGAEGRGPVRRNRVNSVLGAEEEGAGWAASAAE